MTQPSLFDQPPRARRTDPATSHVAASTVNVSRSHQLVLDALAAPATAEELCDQLRGQCSASRVRGAISELKELGLVVVAGYGTTRLGNECEQYARAKC